MSRFALAARALAGIVALVLLPAAVEAQTYPSKPIRLILPYAPGGIIDTAGRYLATRLAESMGVPVVSENRPGAGGAVGVEVTGRAAADGYTIVLTDPGFVSNPTLLPETAYNLKQFQAISIIGSSPAVIVATNNLPVKTFAEFIAYAKTNPGSLNFASAGVGTAPHLAGEMIKLQAGIDMQHIPYRGIGPAYPDLLSGRIQLAFSSIAGAVPFIADKRVQPLATTGIKRSVALPDVPTVAESGLPGFDVDLWTAIYGPVGMPPAILVKLNETINAALKHPELQAAFAKIGIEPRGTSPEEGMAFTQSEYEKWAKVITDGKIKP
jgi:tripartite-type tricarboxylate transporter receptor subunit TctC